VATHVRDRTPPPPPEPELGYEAAEILDLAAVKGHMTVADQKAMREIGRTGPREIRDAVARAAEGRQIPGDAEAISTYRNRTFGRPRDD
jgi:hypothetical protein